MLVVDKKGFRNLNYVLHIHLQYYFQYIAVPIHNIFQIRREGFVISFADHAPTSECVTEMRIPIEGMRKKGQGY